MPKKLPKARKPTKPRKKITKRPKKSRHVK